jgi:hypothetical protein
MSYRLQILGRSASQSAFEVWAGGGVLENVFNLHCYFLRDRDPDLVEAKLRRRELNPGLPRDRRKY